MNIQQFPGHGAVDEPHQTQSDDRYPTLGDLLRERAVDGGDRLFLAFETGAERTYGQVYQRARTIAKGLLALGIGPGDHVGLLMPNGPEAVELVFGIFLAGAVAAPINTRFKSAELADVLPRSAIRLLVTTRAGFTDFVPLVWAAIPELDALHGEGRMRLNQAPALESVVICGGDAVAPGVGLAKVIEAGAIIGDDELDKRTATISAADIAVMLFTSGTTAAPKGCLLSHEGVIRSWHGYARHFGFDSETAFFAPGPIFHLGGLGPLTAAVSTGALILSMHHFEPEAAVRMIAKFRPHHVKSAFPAVTLPLFGSPNFDRARAGYITSVVNVAPMEMQRKLLDMIPDGAALVSGFGMTEASGSVCISRLEDTPEQRLAGGGKLLPGFEVKIVNLEDGRECPAGTTGEIRFRSRTAFRGYFGDPDATAAMIDADGWVATGDYGFVDDRGDLHFVGRIKEMVKVGGENVAAAEVEALLATHPAVRLAQVIGKPDAKYGEVPVAFVELEPDARATPDELADHCRGKLASFKLPREIRIIEQWPMSASKIQKFKLEELLEF